jgi:predicted outer membrane repeat protein
MIVAATPKLRFGLATTATKQRPKSSLMFKGFILYLAVALLVILLPLNLVSTLTAQASSTTNLGLESSGKGVVAAPRPAIKNVVSLTNCTEAGLNAAMQTGGYITVNCPANTTISVTANPDTTTNFRSISISTTLDASPSMSFTISGNNAYQLFQVNSGGNLSLNALTLTGGKAPIHTIYNCNSSYSCNDGGAIFNGGGNIVSINNVSFSNNSAMDMGGAIYNEGSIGSITNSTFTSNSAYTGHGGAIFNIGNIDNITNSTFANNVTSNNDGGAIFNGGGIGSITNSTFTSNSAPTVQGGAIFNTGSIDSITNSTFANNSAYYSGGAIENANTIGSITNSTFANNSSVGNNSSGSGGGAIFNDSTVGSIGSITNSTFANNSASTGQGGAFYNYGNSATISITNSIFSSNSAPTGGNCAGRFNDRGYNLSSDASCGFSTATGSQNNVSNLNLGTLANNGGPTQTIALLSGSTALGVVASGCLATDQRGVRRPATNCDAGAYEGSVYTSTGSYTYYLPFLANQYTPAGSSGSFTSYLAFQNVGTANANVTLTYFDSTGSTLTNATVVTQVVQYAEILPASPFSKSAAGAGVITSDQPLNVIVAEATLFGGSAYAVSAGASSNLIAPLAINKSLGFVTQLTLFNGGASSTTATVNFYDQNGNSPSGSTQNVSIPAHQALTLDQTASASQLPSGFYGWAKITGTSGSTLVAQVLEQRPDIHFVAIANAQSSSHTTLYAPAIFNDAYGGFNTGANIVNPNPSPVTVNVTYYNLAGVATTSAPVVVSANSVLPLYQGASNSGLASGFAGAAVVTSTGNGVVMVVNENNASVTTSSQSGTYSAAIGGNSSVGLPVVANNGYGYTTGTTIFNASSSAVSFKLTYYGIDGQPIAGLTPTSYNLAAYASVGIYQGGVSGLSYGTGVLTQTNGPANALIDTTNALNGGAGLFYTYTEPNS